MLFLMFISFVLNQNLNENYTSKSENQAVIYSEFNFQKGKKDWYHRARLEAWF